MNENFNSTEIEVLKPKEVTKDIRIVNKLDLRSYLEPEQIRERLADVPAGRDKMLILTLWMTGLRISEVLGVSKADIDFINKTMKIRWLKSRKYHERIVPVKRELLNMLEFYVTNLNMIDRIFPYSRQYAHRLIKKHMHVHPHMLRHSFSVNFLRQSQNPQSLVILKNLLGHKNIQTTMEYLRLVPFDMAIELDKIKF